MKDGVRGLVQSLARERGLGVRVGWGWRAVHCWIFKNSSRLFHLLVSPYRPHPPSQPQLCSVRRLFHIFLDPPESYLHSRKGLGERERGREARSGTPSRGHTGSPRISEGSDGKSVPEEAGNAYIGVWLKDQHLPFYNQTCFLYLGPSLLLISLKKKQLE